jgi:hypothetical protein
MNVLDLEADMVQSLARDHPQTYEPTASRAPPKALESQAGLGRARLVALHTQTSLAHWNPSRARLVRVWARSVGLILFVCVCVYVNVCVCECIMYYLNVL